MKKGLLLFTFFAITSLLSAQSYFVKGKIKDSSTGESLNYANVRVMNSFIGASANAEGDYELLLEDGKHNLIFSFIGYRSDTVTINPGKDITLDIELSSVAIELKEVTVKPGKNPAIPIVKNAIRYKNEREKKLRSYEFYAYTKGIIKTTEDISANNNSVTAGLGDTDTSELKITGILENESHGFFLRPDNYKEKIIARKQSANFPPTINTLTGGRLIQNFYTDDIRFFDRPMVSPIANDALDFYYYYLADSLMQDNRKIYKIFFSPENSSEAGFFGHIYIRDKSFEMVKLDVKLNRAANPGGIFTKVNIFQQYLPYGDGIYMPIDYRLFVAGNVMGLVAFGFEINSVLQDYRINSELKADMFDNAILTVLPDADEKNSLYWSKRQKLPNTLEEITAYQRIDSLEAVEKTFWDKFSFLATELNLSKNYGITGPLGLYSFNRIEGHGVNMGVYFHDLLKYRFNGNIETSYGFSDKRFNWNAEGEYLLGKYRTSSISAKVYKKLSTLFAETDQYNKLTSTLTSLLGKYDFRDYFYSKGFEIKGESEVNSFLKLGIGFASRSDKSARVNSDYSIFNKKKKYNANPPIYETNINSVTASFGIDFRKYIEDGYYRRRTSMGKSFFLFNGSVTVANKDFTASDLDFSQYKLNLFSKINSFRATTLEIDVNKIWADNPIPYHMAYALPGNIESGGKDHSFRTLRVGEVFGDDVITFTTEYNLKDELFKMFGIPFLRIPRFNWEFILTELG